MVCACEKKTFTIKYVLALFRVLIPSRSSEEGQVWQKESNSVAGRVNVASERSAPQVSALFWMAVDAAKHVHNKLGSRAMRGTSVTRTKACTATFPKTSHVMRLASVLVSEYFMKYTGVLELFSFTGTQSTTQ